MRNNQAVILNITNAEGLELETIEDSLIEEIDRARTGEFDGNLIGPGEVIFYMYGPDADALHESIRPVIDDIDFPLGSYLVKQYGPPGSESTRVDL